MAIAKALRGGPVFCLIPEAVLRRLRTRYLQESVLLPVAFGLLDADYRWPRAAAHPLYRARTPEPELSLLLNKLKLELPAQPPPRITAGPVPPTPL